METVENHLTSILEKKVALFCSPQAVRTFVIVWRFEEKWHLQWLVKRSVIEFYHYFPGWDTNFTKKPCFITLSHNSSQNLVFILLQNAKPLEDHLRMLHVFSHLNIEISSTMDVHWIRMDTGAQRGLICLEDMLEERRIGAYAASVVQNKVTPV